MRNLLLIATGTVLALGCTPTENEIKESAENSPPVANAGDNITQSADLPVDLNGAGSYDPDGDELIYHWGFDTAPEGSVFGGDSWTLVNNNTVAPSTAFEPDAAGTFVVSLWVEDAYGQSSTADYVIVTVTDGAVPIADAGPELGGAVGDLMTLDGTRSHDPYGRELSHQWSFASTPSTTTITAVDTPSAAVTTFTPDVGGVFVAALVVNNGVSTSAPDTAIVRVTSDVPTAPTAVVGDPIDAEACTAIAISGAGSFDPNDEPLTFQWSLVSAPAQSTVNSASFGDITASETTFYPDLPGSYVLGLTVFDGHTWSDVALQEMEIAERSYNSPPTVEAGADQAIDAGEAECKESGYTYACDECAEQEVTLGSDALVNDPDSDPYTIVWELLSGNAEIDDPSSLVTTATLTDAEPTEPGVCEDTIYEFQLTATDCYGDVVTDIVTFTATCCGIEEATGTTGSTP